MGTIRKRGRGYYAEVAIAGQRKGHTARTKAGAEAWIRDTEQRLREALPEHTVEELFDRYAATYSKTKRTHVAEARRCVRLARELGRETRLTALSCDHLARWRDQQLTQRQPASVRRDWSLLNHALNVAVREWGWLKTNPLAGLSRPKKPPPRTRTWSGEELARFLLCAGHPGATRQARVGDALLFALETGMRAGEITRIRPAHVHARHVHIPHSKNGSARDVPLSSAARRILAAVGGDFGLSDAQLNALYRKARDRAALKDLRFHDARRTALTTLSKKLDALELARISGHKDLRMLLETYYQPRIEDLADKLD